MSKLTNEEIEELAPIILDWIERGERLAEAYRGRFYLFRIGEWWADRPWRKFDETN